jgi:hypothetical protein
MFGHYHNLHFRPGGEVCDYTEVRFLASMMADRAETGAITLSRTQGRGADLWFGATIKLAAVHNFQLLFFSFLIERRSAAVFDHIVCPALTTAKPVASIVPTMGRTSDCRLVANEHFARSTR